VATTFLDAAARAGFERAVQTIESASAAEIVIAVRRRSAGYLHAHVVVGAVVAIAALAVMLFAEDEFSLPSILIDPFVAGGIAGALIELAPGVQRLLTPAARRRAGVLRAARATFVERGVHNTTGRTGVLVYISWLEREVALVFDSGIERTFAAEPRAAAARALTAAMPAGGAAVAEALAQLAPPLAAAAPHRADDVNELPDAIDSDLRGAR
jgi:putative membrane protein